MGTVYSSRSTVIPKTFVAFSDKKLIQAGYVEKVGLEPGDPEWDWAKKHFTVWQWMKDTWDINYGNNLKNRFKVPWRPRAPHRWSKLKWIPLVIAFFYSFEYVGDKLNEIYERENPETPTWMDWYQVPHFLEYNSKWIYDEIDKWKTFDQNMRLRNAVRRSQGKEKFKPYKVPPPEDWD